MLNRQIPLSKLDLSVIPTPADELSEAQIDDFREHVFELESDLSRCETTERLLLGLLCLLFVIDTLCGFFFFRDSTVWIAVNGGNSAAIAYTAIQYYGARQSRIGAETLYYRTILGRAYRP